MILHRAETRGKAFHGWLKSHHTFSFANYYDPNRMGFGVLRVLNDDCVAPGMGFGTHPHRDMEIISIPLEGSLRHEDSEGHSGLIQKGEIQIMSAGTGILHSEENASTESEVKFLQIWVLPKKLGILPRYAQRFFSEDERRNRFQLIVSPDGRENSLIINQDAYVSLTDLDPGASLTYQGHGRSGLYVFVLKGEVEVKGMLLSKRDGLGIEHFSEVPVIAKSECELLLMEVPL